MTIWHMQIKTPDIVIRSDSQTGAKALSYPLLDSGTVYEFQRYQNEFEEWFNLNFIWVLGHTDILENCKANELTRLDTNKKLPQRLFPWESAATLYTVL